MRFVQFHWTLNKLHSPVGLPVNGALVYADEPKKLQPHFPIKNIEKFTLLHFAGPKGVFEGFHQFQVLLNCPPFTEADHSKKD